MNGIRSHHGHLPQKKDIAVAQNTIYDTLYIPHTVRQESLSAISKRQYDYLHKHINILLKQEVVFRTQ